MGDAELSLLLDTHVWIWSQETPAELGEGTRKLLSDPEQVIYVSPVSTLEMARLAARGTIRLSGSLLDWVNDTIEALQAMTLEFSHAVAEESYSLPGSFHKDPADRILAASARLNQLTLVTADDRLLEYLHVESHDARR